jgi:hypothetical protein
MTTSNRIDIASLVKTAKNSEQKESYIVVEKTKHYRIGAGVRISASSPSFFLEVIIHRSATIIKHILFIKALQERGYLVSCQEETCTVLELILPPDSLISEVVYLKTMFKNTFQD